MKISCNILKKHIKNSESIDFVKIWDTFSIRTAEVEEVVKVGYDLKDIVVAEIVECVEHPEKPQYHILKVNSGTEVVDILCGAPNARLGLKTALVKVGGSVLGFTIEPKKIAGVTSHGMLCSGAELGISEDHDGIIELPTSFEVGRSIKDYLEVEDIIVEIDNKSLTNRPDLWGHYGIAREIAAISGLELLELDVYNSDISGDKLDITVHNYDLCPRYTALKIDNILENKTPLDMQIKLFYTGMRSISLLVDLTNYLMLELGQPMHAFDSTNIQEIEVGLGTDSSTFTTLDNAERKIDSSMLMIKNNHKYFAIAGVMGGLDSGINDNTSSIVLESANFDAYSVRTTATKLGLRTEASARYEKSIDPNLTIMALRRFVKLLMDVNPELRFGSRITDCYKELFKEKIISLPKSLIKTYIDQNLSSMEITKILESLSFKITETGDSFEVVVPTFRATKDITIAVDLIEEIARIYGYENFKTEPLKVDLTFGVNNTEYQDEYNLKSLLATKYNMHEVHSYVWYKSSLLNLLKINKNNTTLLGRSEDNILRDDLSLSLLDAVLTNLKNSEKFNIFELGTVFIENTNKKYLSSILVDDLANSEQVYYNAKRLIADSLKTYKNKAVVFNEISGDAIYEKIVQVKVDNCILGNIKIFNGEIIAKINKKKIIVAVELDIDLYHTLNTDFVKYQEVSKYPTVSLDYTIVMSKDKTYQELNNILKLLNTTYLMKSEYLGKYEINAEINYSFRFILGSNEKTLSEEDINLFKTEFTNLVNNNNLKIVA